MKLKQGNIGKRITGDYEKIVVLEKGQYKEIPLPRNTF